MVEPLRSSDATYAMSLHSTSDRGELDVGHDSDHVISSPHQICAHLELPCALYHFLYYRSNAFKLFYSLQVYLAS